MRLGTWSTFDCPEETKIRLEAFIWLRNKVEEIDGNIRIGFNDHDFGRYPSFEVDMPRGMIEPDYDYESSEEENKLASEYEAWVDKINEIESEYNNKFLN